jgi:predicted nuclease of predicted toxin-antitoxin system
VGLRHASDAEILDAASRRIGSCLRGLGLRCVAGASTPIASVVRVAAAVEPLTPQQQALLLTANLPSVEKDLDEGAIAVLDRRRLRIRPLPIDRR